MKRILIIAAATAVLSFPALGAEPSVCKGLDQGACTSNSACTWRPAVKVGDALKKGGEAKRAVKAHCRKGKAALPKQA